MDKKLLKNLEQETICGYVVSAKMKRVWNVELNLLLIFQELCKANNLKYYAFGGTLLGAVRHKGFIPWDNDIDVAMPRNDYERFIEIAQSSIKYPFFLQSFWSERSFACDMLRLRDSRTCAITKTESINKGNKGIFLDIFPVDNIPDDKEIEKNENIKHRIHCHIISFISKKNSNYKGIKKITVNSIRYLCAHIISQKIKVFLVNKLIADISKYNSTETEYCGLRCFFWGAKRFQWKNEDIVETIELPFEEMTIVVPKGYDSLLTDLYGDYNRFVMGTSCHEGTIFEPDIPFEEYLNRQMSKKKPQ